MYQDDYFNPANQNEYDNNANEDAITNKLKNDSGLNTLTVKVYLENGRTKNKRIKVYTSGSAGSNIRDAETGVFYSNKVGSMDEELFFKVTIATGECNSANGSNTLFYCSPQHYENHLHSEVDQEQIALWEVRRDARMKLLNKETTPKFSTIIVK